MRVSGSESRAAGFALKSGPRRAPAASAAAALAAAPALLSTKWGSPCLSLGRSAPDCTRPQRHLQPFDTPLPPNAEDLVMLK